MDEPGIPPVAGPIQNAHVTTVSDRRGVDEDDLADALAAIHEEMADGADAILEYYRSRDESPSIEVADGLATVVVVEPAEWPKLPTDQGEAVRAAAKAVHEATARSAGAPAAVLEAGDPLVMPASEVGELVRAGLSRRQAEVQVLRNDGRTMAEIAETLGLATNTVKVHSHRIDAKVAAAEELLETVQAG